MILLRKWETFFPAKNIKIYSKKEAIKHVAIMIANAVWNLVRAKKIKKLVQNLADLVLQKKKQRKIFYQDCFDFPKLLTNKDLKNKLRPY